ncbi:MAG: PIN domain-containing protein [Candidatus Micrarchaeota archaeon]
MSAYTVRFAHGPRFSAGRSSAILIFERPARRLSPDPDDWPFFALALSRDCGIWSNDKRLKKQAKVKVWSTEELSAHLKIG